MADFKSIILLSNSNLTCLRSYLRNWNHILSQGLHLERLHLEEISLIQIQAWSDLVKRLVDYPD